MPKLFLSLSCLLMIIKVSAQVKLPRLINDSMILQRDIDVQIWGWAAVDEKVAVTFRDQTYATTAGKDGKWMISLSPMHAGEPYDMQIDASNHITIKNILVGDVWICSGQSNMELPMERLKDKYPAIISAANNSNIRQFNVSTNYNFHAAQQDLPSGNWETTTPQSVLHFTAVGYFFAKALYEKYHVPVGLIKAAVGGSPAEAWLSEDALKQFPAYLYKTDTLKNDAYVDSIKKSDKANSDAWYNNIWQRDKGLHDEKKWYDTGYDASSWQTMQVPGYWKDAGLPDTNGVVWFRKAFDVPANMRNKPLRLFLGTIIDRDSVYINGTFVGATQYQYPPRKYIVPAGLLKEGKNILVVRVINYAGSGGFTKDKPYKLFTGNDTIDLAGTWQYKLGAAAGPIPSSTTFNYMPGGLYNAMTAPLTSYSIKGVIWYQGESNASRASEYHQLFAAVIKDWRRQWQQGDFPFLYVQLANFMQTKEQPSESDWAELREAQLKTLAVPNTAIVVTTDIGEWNDIHPLNKEDVGKRLALAAEKIAYYEKDIVYSGPLYQSMKIDGNKIIISFTNTGSGLMAKNGDLKYFSIASSDKKFIWAKATIKNNTVIVWNDAIKDPVAVRYAWADNPEGANLYNKEGLPASAFATDK
ncbi:sialate O-acetylesterase [Panacibacter ginsenosidivorans]|uniref:Sialate O-acetylesterase n=1 Tax=Panacibacter ginsenosidivorans TaxID=1813871 RepID=A0A5B8VBE7_9BACT|nr:sialate O-acetylesterase [Panacibacter ginsenosidivorans]QEC68323.1 sialate O-acetylesterase [Panacibacter ginsenosidivorans]